MIIDARDLLPETELRAQVCIIGSGAAGTTLALELAAAGVDVIVLEAGGERGQGRAQETLRAAGGGTGAHDALEHVRQKRLGGTTMQWGGRCTPMDPLDFDRRAHVPMSGWPFDRTHLDPFYRRAHQYLDLGEFEYRASRAVAEVPPLIGDGPGASSVVDDDRIWRWSPPVRFGKRYRPQLAASPRVRVYTHANAVELLQEPGEQRVRHVRVVVNPGREIRVAALVTVVAAGGLECARLLLASRTTTTGGLGSSSGLLGATYMTHPVAEVGELRFNDPTRGRAGEFMVSRDGVYARRMLALRPEAQRREGLLNTGLALWYPDPMDPAHGDGLLSLFALVRRTLTRSGLDWKAIGIQSRYGQTTGVRQHLRNVLHEVPRLSLYSAYWLRHRYLASRTLPSFYSQSEAGRYRLRLDAEQSPDRRNRVELSRDRDEFGMPRLVVHYGVSLDDRQSMVRTLELLQGEFQQRGVGTLTLPPAEHLLHEVQFADGTHQMGVTRMASSAAEGVVDEHCKVHDAPNVYVASSSVFPTGGMCGPTLTITALAIRLADHLVAQLAR